MNDTRGFEVTVKLTIEAVDYSAAVAEVERRLLRDKDGHYHTFPASDPAQVVIRQLDGKKIRGI